MSEEGALKACPIDEACVNLCVSLNALPGVTTVESRCGHGVDPFRIWLKFTETMQSLGAVTLARCLSGRYYTYAPGELRSDPEWRLCMGDSDGPVIFRLEGKTMCDGIGLHPPAEKLARNLSEYVRTLSVFPPV